MITTPAMARAGTSPTRITGGWRCCISKLFHPHNDHSGFSPLVAAGAQHYLEQFNPPAADVVLRQLRAALRLLPDYPEARSLFAALDNRRRFVSGEYVIDHRISGRLLEVSHIRHGRQLPLDLDAAED